MTERNQLLALYEITKTLTSSMNYGKNLRYVVNLLQSYTDFENILIVLNSIDNNEIVEISTYKDLTYKKGEGIIGKVWKHGIPIVIPDVSEEKEFLNKIKRDLKIYKNGKLAFIAVPIKTESDILGVLAADKFHRDDESLDYSLRFLTMVANLLGSSIKLFLELQKEKLKLEEEKKLLRNRLEGLTSKTGLEGVIGKSKQIIDIVDTIKTVAPTTATVLLTGESGVGKEVFAKAIHELSDRKDKPFIKLNCAAIPEELLESELFGYEKGAFTGANSTKKGKFELADGGTIFLDEIGDMPLLLQSKILRVLQEKEIERLGSSKPIKIDVRIIAATNKNLEKMVYEGTFREDLFYRLNVVSIYIPPLRERKEDIQLLIIYFLEKFNKIYGKDITISYQLLNALVDFDWPGNVRQLQNTIERMVILAKSSRLDLDDLPIDIKNKLKESKASITKTEIEYSDNVILPKTVEELEVNAIKRALEESGFIIKKAAQILGITPRQLRYRMDKYKIPFRK